MPELYLRLRMPGRNVNQPIDMTEEEGTGVAGGIAHWLMTRALGVRRCRGRGRGGQRTQSDADQ